MSRLPSLALRNVGRNRRRTLITAVTIIFGVAMIILVRGFTWGMAQLLTADSVEGRIGAIQVHRTGYVDNVDAVPTRLNLPYSPELIGKLRATPHVTGVTGRIMFNGLVSNGISQTMFIGRGLDLAHEKEACPKWTVQVNEGEMLTLGEANQALVGYELAESFKLKPGSTVTLSTTSPAGRSNSLDLTTRGLTTSSFPFENKRVVTVPLGTAQALLGLEGRVTEYAVAIDDLAHLDEVAESMRVALGPEYEVHTWGDIQPFARDLINRMLVVLSAIGTVLFVIVLTGIVNTMLMSVFERVREIGTLLAVGVRRRQVMTLFIIEGGVIGLFGGVAGALVGRLLVGLIGVNGITIKLSGVSAVAVLRPTVSTEFVGVAVVIAVVGALLATAWPAWRASRLNPVDALRTT